MTRRIVLRPAAEADIDAASGWLEEQSPQSAARFWRVIDETLLRLRENPLQYQRVLGNTRRVVLGTFRYALFYFDTETEIVVIACIHTSRHPRRWQARIPE
jgi:toxin ParE1/3/4